MTDRDVSTQHPDHRPASGFAARLSPLIASAGVVAVPALLVRHQARLGLTSAELTYVLHVLLHRWDGATWPWVAVESVAEAAGVHLTVARRWKASLEAKGYLVARRRMLAHIGRGADEHDLSRLFAALERLAEEEQTRKALDQVRGELPTRVYAADGLTDVPQLSTGDPRKNARRLTRRNARDVASDSARYPRAEMLGASRAESLGEQEPSPQEPGLRDTSGRGHAQETTPSRARALAAARPGQSKTGSENPTDDRSSTVNAARELPAAASLTHARPVAAAGSTRTALAAAASPVAADAPRAEAAWRGTTDVPTAGVATAASTDVSAGALVEEPGFRLPLKPADRPVEARDVARPRAPAWSAGPAAAMERVGAALPTETVGGEADVSVREALEAAMARRVAERGGQDRGGGWVVPPGYDEGIWSQLERWCEEFGDNDPSRSLEACHRAWWNADVPREAMHNAMKAAYYSTNRLSRLGRLERPMAYFLKALGTALVDEQVRLGRPPARARAS